MTISAILNAKQLKKPIDVLEHSTLKLKVQDIVAIINNNASSEALKEIFGSGAKITKKNLVDVVAKQGQYYKLNKGGIRLHRGYNK